MRGQQPVDFDTEPKRFLTSAGVTADEHYAVQTKQPMRYMAAIKLLEEYGIEMPQSSRVRALAMSIARADNDMTNALLTDREKFGPVEVYRAMQVLDSGRQVRVEQRKLERLQALQATSGKVKARTLGKIKSKIDNLNQHKPKHGSASGAVCSKLKEWVREFSKAELEFIALHFPTKAWKGLAEICHFNPEQDFPELPWFLPFVFGTSPPVDSLVYQCRDLNKKNVNKILKGGVKIPFSHIKQYHKYLTDESKLFIAVSCPKLDTIIWNYEELRCEGLDELIKSRLRAGEKIALPYGKMMEHLIMLHDSNVTAPFIEDLVAIADDSLRNISLNLDSPVVVLGDASASMEVAIRTATIISSLLTAVCSAKLVFFNTVNMEPPFLPKTIAEVLKLAMQMKASRATAPAASLYPFYERKEIVKTFILVTDEEENTLFKGYRFTPLFQKYHVEVYPARLVLVSFLNQNAVGQMYSELEPEFKPIQFKFDSRRPDLNKLGNMFGLLASFTEGFEQRLALIEEKICGDGDVGRAGYAAVFKRKDLV
ncbi:uncharacterized protein LOC141910252 [Tubulanus polymorphus]|uniref:uncharacterized protein LOC141910252 n=1 Tax=Tubulanus polymorphus TaxID=672921 RepID=UPI003DA5B404